VTVEFTNLLLASVAPDELAVLDESAREYFADPAAALADGREDVPLGSGLDVAMITPYLMAVASAVLPVPRSASGCGATPSPPAAPPIGPECGPLRRACSAAPCSASCPGSPASASVARRCCSCSP
jgi:hypothetical protein